MMSSYHGFNSGRDATSSASSMGHLDLLSKAIEDEESSAPSRITSSSSGSMSKLSFHSIDGGIDRGSGILGHSSHHKTSKRHQTLVKLNRALPPSPSSSKDESETGVEASATTATASVSGTSVSTGSNKNATAATANNAPSSDFCSPQHHQMVAMPSDFVPGPFDVLCGRGRACKTAAGNLAYRDSILLCLAQYGAAESKLAKGSIISDIMQSVRKKCHDFHQQDGVGGFIKCVQGVWYEVGDFLAREKTSQCFRDALASNYSSSAQSKYLRRRAKESGSGAVVGVGGVAEMGTMAPVGPLSSASDHLYQQQQQQHHSLSASSAISSPPTQSSTVTVRKSLDEALAQLPFKKRKRRLSEDAAIDVLQQMASSSMHGHHGPPRHYHHHHQSAAAPDAISASSPNTSSSVSSLAMSAVTDCTTSSARTTSPVIAIQGCLPPNKTSIMEHQHSTRATTVPPPAPSPPRALVAVVPPQPPASTAPMPPVPRPPITSTSPCSQPPTSPMLENEVRVCALQAELRPPSQSPWDALMRVQRLMETIASNEAVDVFVLPELAPVGYSEDTFARFLPVNPSNQAMYQEFDRFFQIAARNLNVYICYGTIGWSFDASSNRRNILDSSSHHHTPLGNHATVVLPKMYIRQIVVDRLGTQVACYDKTHLSDYGARPESRFFTAGPASHPTSFVVHCLNRSASFRFGLLIGADVCDASLARRLTTSSDHRVDCILQPAALHRQGHALAHPDHHSVPPQWFRMPHWAAFQLTRAMENAVYWIAVNPAGEAFGESAIVAPMTVDNDSESAPQPMRLGTEPGYVMGRVARRVLDHVRRSVPLYRNLLLAESNHSLHKEG